MKHKLIYGLLGLILGGCAAFSRAYLYIHPINIHSVLAENHLLPEPETLTELYFEDHLKLPNKLISGKSYNFRFTIHNLEYKEMEYRYQVTVTGYGFQTLGKTEEPVTIANGEKTLKQDEYATIPVEFTLPKKITADRMKIEVNLIDFNQPIHFWLENEEKKAK